MDLKEIFDKATSENKSLTYDEFIELANSSKAKFTDLSEGRYVDRQKYEDDIAKKDTEITTLNDTINQRNNDLTDLKSQLENAGNDASKLEELTGSLTALQSKYDADTKALNEKLSAQAYEFAVRDFAGTQKFSSKAARREFEREMIAKNLPLEDGRIMGADDFAKAYAKNDPDAFVRADKPDSNNTPHFTAPAGGDKNKGSKMSLTEMMQKKNEDPNFVVNFD